MHRLEMGIFFAAIYASCLLQSTPDHHHLIELAGEPQAQKETDWEYLTAKLIGGTAISESTIQSPDGKTHSYNRYGSFRKAGECLNGATRLRSAWCSSSSELEMEQIVCSFEDSCPRLNEPTADVSYVVTKNLGIYWWNRGKIPEWLRKNFKHDGNRLPETSKDWILTKDFPQVDDVELQLTEWRSFFFESKERVQDRWRTTIKLGNHNLKPMEWPPE